MKTPLLKITGPFAEVRKGRPDRYRIDLRYGRERCKRYRSRDVARRLKGEMEEALARGIFIQSFPEEADELKMRPTVHKYMLWEEAEKLHLADLHKRNARNPYPDRLAGTLRRAREFLHNPRVADVTRDDLVAFITSRGGTEKSRKTLRSAVTGLMNFCARNGWCERGAFDKLDWLEIMQDEKPPEFMSNEEVELLLQYAFCFRSGGNGKRRVVDLVRTNQFRACLVIAIFLGVRPGTEQTGGGRAGELPQLKRCHLNMKEKTLTVPSSIAKTRKERIITKIPDWVLSMIRAGKYDQEDFLMPFSYGRFQDLVVEARKRAHQQTGIKLTFVQKIFRHTFGTNAFWRDLSWAINAGGWVNSEILTTHYKGNTNEEKANAFWEMNLRPLTEKGVARLGPEMFSSRKPKYRKRLEISEPKGPFKNRKKPFALYFRYGYEYVKRYFATQEEASYQSELIMKAFQERKMDMRFPDLWKALGME